MSIDVDVLIPTRNRAAELAVCLSALAAQDHPTFGVVVSDQSDGAPGYDTPAVRGITRVLNFHRHPVRTLRNLPRRGLAHQRAVLLAESTADYVLMLDDDVWLEPWAIRRLRTAIGELQCGFLGFAVQGLSYLGDHRPAELSPYEEWEGPPQPEALNATSPAFRRWTLHNAANPTHLAEQLELEPGEWRAYKVAWIGGCVLFDRSVLVASGGFDFWSELPEEHSGEDVVAQWRVMARAGGAGILPSGAIHLEAPTTVPNREVEARNVVSVRSVS
jgi:glycosyltransferase involved in cell wall biosynthesis